VSPHRGGGWCQALQRPREAFDRQTVTCAWWKRQDGPFGFGYVGPELFAGRAAVTRGRELRLLFTEGKSLGIPVNSGFYLYRVPEQRLLRAPPRALVLREGGREVARLSIPDFYADQPLIGSSHRPGGADVDRARRLLVARTRVGPAALMVAPSKLAPATCWWLQIRRAVYGGGCARTDRVTSAIWEVAPAVLRVRDHELWILWGQAGSRFASLELRLQDGRRQSLAIRKGFFLYVVPGVERVRGRRPAVLIGRAPGGRALRKELLLSFAWAR
jgi:hypothetical protein